MKRFFLNLIIAGAAIISFSSCQDEFKKAGKDEKFDMAEFFVNHSDSPEYQAFFEIMYSMVELSPEGFKLNATKQDFKDRGVDTYWYYALRDSLKETYKDLKKGKFQIPELPDADWIQLYIETYNKQKEEFWASATK